MSRAIGDFHRDVVQAGILEGARFQARRWGRKAREWRDSGRTDETARRGYAYCRARAVEWARYTVC